MTSTPPDSRPVPRPAEERRQAVLDRLATEHDVWVATAGPDGIHGEHELTGRRLMRDGVWS